MSGASLKKPEGAVFIGVIAAFVVLLLLTLGVKGWVPIEWAVATIGIVTFLGMLVYAYHLTGALDKGQMRLALATSVVVVYFSLVPLLTFGGTSPQDPELAKSVIGHFTTLVGVVIAFYFGSATVKYAAKLWALNKLPEADRKTELLKHI